VMCCCCCCSTVIVDSVFFLTLEIIGDIGGSGGKMRLHLALSRKDLDRHSTIRQNVAPGEPVNCCLLIPKTTNSMGRHLTIRKSHASHVFIVPGMVRQHHG
jgi:hypothetical protein